jgi:hypothetical protein
MTTGAAAPAAAATAVASTAGLARRLDRVRSVTAADEHSHHDREENAHAALLVRDSEERYALVT